MTKKKPANVTAEAWKQRQRVWRHNAFQGQCAMMEAILNSMMTADSTSDFVKYRAKYILDHVVMIRKEIKERIDP